MSKKTYRIYGIATIGKYLGEVTAESKEEALDKAETDDAITANHHISICHHCSRQMQDTPEITELQAEEVEE